MEGFKGLKTKVETCLPQAGTKEEINHKKIKVEG